MNLVISDKKNFNYFIKANFTYLMRDKAAVAIFVLIYIKTLLFMNILGTYGASRLSFKMDTIYLYPFTAFFFTLSIISFSFLAKKRLHLYLLMLINIVFSILLIGDLWYYRGFNDFLNFHLFSELKNLNNLSSSVISMFRPIDLIFVIDNLFIIPLALYLTKSYSNFNKSKGAFTLILSFSFVILTVMHLTLDYHDKDYSGPELFKTQYVPYSTMRNLSPIGYHIYDAAMFLKDSTPYIMSSEDKEKINSWLQYKNENLPDNMYKGIFSNKNLILIQVESLENFVINQNYKGQEITPNINKILKNSLYFSNFYEQVNNGNSADSDLMVNSSVYPVRRGSTFFRFPNNSYNTLAMLLKEKNYSTKALHSDYGYYWNVENALVNFGFDEFKDIRDFDNSDTFWMGLTDESFFRQVGEIAKNQTTPFYYFTVTSTSHSPFKMPENFKNLKLNESLDNTYMGGYLQSISYADKQIGNFISELDKQGILDSTVIVIYGDHNGVHKYYSDEVSKISPQEAWWNNNGRVPFIIYSKNLQGEEIKTIGGQIDVLPTIAYSFGIEKDKYENTSMGRNLLNTKKSFALLNNGTIVGKEQLNSEDIEHIKESFDISDKIVRANYFKK